METDVLELTRQLVAVDSQNPGPGESAMAALVEETARGSDFEVTRLELTAGRPNVVISVDTGPGPHLGLCGHLDTKPVGDSRSEWRSDPFELTVVDGVAFGLGSSDMKGAIAAMLLALRKHAEAGPPGRVSLFLTADEEQGSDAGAKVLADRDLVDVDAMVIAEPSGVDEPWEMLALVSRGICCFEIELTTRQGHSGLSPRLGRNAVLLAADVLLALERFEPPVAVPGAVPASPTVNPGMLVSGGVCFGTWPGVSSVACEIRLVPGMHKEDVRRAVEETVASAVGDQGSFRIRYAEGSLGWMPAVELDPASLVVASAQSACRAVLGRELPLAAYPGGTDATYLMGRAGIPTITSLGPGWLSVAHGPNECVAVDDLGTAVELYHHLMGDFLTRRTKGKP